jgi:hypothetical protein
MAGSGCNNPMSALPMWRLRSPLVAFSPHRFRRHGLSTGRKLARRKIMNSTRRETREQLLEMLHEHQGATAVERVKKFLVEINEIPAAESDPTVSLPRHVVF